jgi:hypothetical protein
VSNFNANTLEILGILPTFQKWKKNFSLSVFHEKTDKLIFKFLNPKKIGKKG